MAMNPRAIVVRVRGDAGGLKIINKLNAASDPLHFVLLFSPGELGPSIFCARVAALHSSIKFSFAPNLLFLLPFLVIKKGLGCDGRSASRVTRRSKAARVGR